MILLGLAGHAASGKDTVADYLMSRYEFVKFSFSDALYREVAEAFGLEDESLLRDRDSKEKPLACLRLEYCNDPDFVVVAKTMLDMEGGVTLPHTLKPHSPRWILQVWGTEYRRAQDPDYWLAQAEDWLLGYRAQFPYAETAPQLFVNTSVRFENEREFITDTENWYRSAWAGTIWHIHRDTAAPVHAHESETPLPVLDGERQIWNNSSIDHLHRAVDLLLSTNTPTVRCEPMKPMTEPEPAMLPHGPYCCEKGGEQHKTVCDECNETSRLYQEQS